MATPIDKHRRSELREFLMSRRARVTPVEAGLPDGGARRRTPGLRREEVAVLAGVGVSWYQWLEQGRDITVSPQVLDSVGRVLKMSSAERRHLYVLAGLNPPALEVAPADRDMCQGLKRLIDAWMPFPAHIMDVYWNTVLYNDAAALVLGMRPEIVQNCLIAFFTDPIYKARSPHWADIACTVVAQYRAASSEWPEDEGFRAVIEEARSSAPSSPRCGTSGTSGPAARSARRSSTRSWGRCSSSRRSCAYRPGPTSRSCCTPRCRPPTRRRSWSG